MALAMPLSDEDPTEGTTMNTSTRTALAVVITLAFGACAAETKGPGLPPPDLAGKADFADRVSMKGALELAESGGALLAERGAEFSEDFEYHGFRLRTRAGSKLKIEVTQRGTSRGLDTILYVYGPYGSGGYQARLDMDDDAGWGSLSRIDELEAPETGDYLVVVGTHDGIGRGGYNLAATCLTGDCLDGGEAPATCPSRVEESIYDCVEMFISEGGYENTRHEGFAVCITDYNDWHYEAACHATSSVEDWCLGGYESYRLDVLPGCVAALEGAFPEDRDRLGFAHRAFDSELESRLEGTWSECCSASGASMTVIAPESGEDVTLEWVVDSIRQADEMSGIWHTNASGDLAGFNSQAGAYDLGDDFVTRLSADAGSDAFSLGHLSANWYPAAGAEAWEDIYVFHFDNGVVTTIRFSSGET